MAHRKFRPSWLVTVHASSSMHNGVEVRLTAMQGGPHYWRIVEWAAESFERAGMGVTVERQGLDATELCRRVGRGDADATVTIDCAAWMAAEGRGVYAGESWPVAGVAAIMHPRHYLFSMIASDRGVDSYSSLAAARPAITLCVRPRTYVAGTITRALFTHSGIDVDADIPAWGGAVRHAPPDPSRRLVAGEFDALVIESTRLGYPQLASLGRRMTLLDVEQEVAHAVSDEFGVPVVQMADGPEGDSRVVTSVGATNYVVAVRADMSEAQAHMLAHALNTSSASHCVSEDIFYTPRHAGEMVSTVHPGAARYYAELGVPC